MREFTALFTELDSSTSTTAKVAALVAHWRKVPPADAAWAAYLLAGGKPRQAVPTAVLRRAACDWAGIDDWLFEECYQVVGDLAETIAHVLPVAAPLDGASAPSIATGQAGAAGWDWMGSDGSYRDAGALPLDGLADWMEQGVLPLRGLEPEEQMRRLRRLWAGLDGTGRFLLTKLVGGGFRVGVSRLLVERSLAEFARISPLSVAQRMMGCTSATRRPSATDFLDWTAPEGEARTADHGSPYPFFLAQSVGADTPLERLGPSSDWLVEWKYDGIRAQLVRRGGGVWIWSRGEELVTERFPEVVEAAAALQDGTVLDGELLVVRGEGGAHRVAPFAELQTRITRKVVGKALRERTPVAFVAYDLLESEGQDRRGWPQWQRRQALDALQPLHDLQAGVGGAEPVEGAPNGGAGAGEQTSVSRLLRAPVVAYGAGVGHVAMSWEALRTLREQSRARGVEGFMLKHRQSPYGVGRRKVEQGGWWKWKIDPMSVDAVLVYAQAGHGRRAHLYTDYTFGVWNRRPVDAEEVQAVLEAIRRREPPSEQGLRLVPFAKAYSGLSDAEMAAVDKVIRATTVEKFGPVRSVVPSLVFELGFEAIAPSPRHKSGVAVRFPRMLRWRQDKPLGEADTLETLRLLRG